MPSNYKSVIFKNTPTVCDTGRSTIKDQQIGSGVIESACKHVVAERCRQAGMRWTQPGINAILFWRCLLKNDALETYWDTQAKQTAA